MLVQLTLLFIFLHSYVSLVGLTNSSIGRSSNQHDVCRKVVEVDSVLHVKLVPAWRRGRWVDDLVVYLFVGGVDTIKWVFWQKSMRLMLLSLMENLSGCLMYTVQRMLFYQKYGFAKAIVVPASENV